MTLACDWMLYVKTKNHGAWTWGEMEASPIDLMIKFSAAAAGWPGGRNKGKQLKHKPYAALEGE